MKENTSQVLVQAPPEIANYLLNEKRRALVEIEMRHDAPIIIVADDQLETPHFNVSRLREGEVGDEVSKPSYHRTSPRKLEVHALTKAHINVPVLPAVTNVSPSQPAPTREFREDVAPVVEEARAARPAPVVAKRGFWAWLKSLFASEPAPASPAPQRSERNDRGDRGDRNDRNSQRGGDQRRGRSGQQQNTRSTQGSSRQPSQAQGGRQQNQTKPEQAAAKPQRNEPKPERSEEQKLQDEQRKLEQQRKEAERRENQRQENIKREAERRAAREARLAAQATDVTGGIAEDGDVKAVTAETGELQAPEGVVTDGVPTAAGAEAGAGEGGRRRRGRRGGRRRRRQEGGPAGEVADATSSQSEIDFEDEEDGEEFEAEGGSAVASGSMPAATRAPVVVSSLPVTSAESEFDDIPMDQPVSAPAVVAAPAVAAAPTSVPEPARVEPASQPEQPVMASLSTPSVSGSYELAAEPMLVPAPVVSVTVQPMQSSMIVEPVVVTMPAPAMPAPAMQVPAITAAVIEATVSLAEEVAATEVEPAPAEPPPAAAKVALEQNAAPANDAEGEVRNAPTA